MKKQLMFLLCTMVMLTGLLSLASGQQILPKTKTNLMNAQNPGQDKILTMLQAQQEFLHLMKARTEALGQHAEIQAQIKNYAPAEKIRTFLQALEKARANGLGSQDVVRAVLPVKKSLAKSASSGAITGMVTVAGNPPVSPVEVMIFDAYGFLAGMQVADGSGAYAIENLQPGQYYVVTNSGYVDEMYNDVPLALFQNWRLGELVPVTANETVSAINFDLRLGATVTGTVYQEDGTTPMSAFIEFTITAADNPQIEFERYAYTSITGTYEILIPAVGDFKIMAVSQGYASEYYNNKSSLLTADIVNIASLDATVDNIDFSLALETIPQDQGAFITGTVYGTDVYMESKFVTVSDSVPIGFVFVFAFDAASQSIAGLSLTGFDGNYTFSDLDPGVYVLYANHYLDALIQPHAIGKYYKDAATPDQADPLVIASKSDSLTDIDFNLDTGGAIEGTIKDQAGNIMAEVPVLAVREADFTNLESLMISDVDVGVGISDSSGTYIIGGLSGGTYILRTLSVLNNLLAGEDSGLSLRVQTEMPVLDEYYEDVYSLWNVDAAQPIAVTESAVTDNIDFTLEFGGMISGHFYETDGSTMISGDGLVFALEEQSELPALALPFYDAGDGSYVVGPLASNNYKLFAIVDNGILGDNELLGTPLTRKNEPLSQQDDDVIYLPQFYNGKLTLAEADVVAVTAPGITADKDFLMVRAATLQGFVYLPNGTPVGADSLFESLVVAYDAASGEVRGVTNTTFSGGYKLCGLPPGDFKVAAVVAADGVACTYFGGGNFFDSANSAVVTVLPADMKTADINLTAGVGAISGEVTDFKQSAPLRGILVLAYDATGHVVSAALSGLDINRLAPLPNPAQYKITGLVAGNYTVRTFALFKLLQLFEDEDISDSLLDLDIMNLIGLIFSAGGDLLDNLDLYQDQWFEAIAIEPDLPDLDLMSLLVQLMADGLRLELLMPLFDPAPSSAVEIAITNVEATGKDFQLKNMDLATAVSDNTPVVNLPESYSLHQNYPNPFNPETRIVYSLPEMAQVKIVVFNLLGQRIRTLFDGLQTAGQHTAYWDGRDHSGRQMAGGIYIARMHTQQVVLARKMLMIK